MNAKQKGNRFEREVAKILNKKFDANVRRTPMSGGMGFKGDIIQLTGILSRFSIECKNQEKLNIWKALEQSRNDAERMKIPVVVFTRNRDRNYIALELDDFLNLIKELEEHYI